MSRFTPKHTAKALAALAASSSLAFGAYGLATPAAHADPMYSTTATPLVGVGSNTIQDLFDAFSGAAPTANNSPALSGTGTPQPTKFFTPLHDPTTGVQVASFSAINQKTGAIGDCISTKLGDAAMERPNGSGDGLHALSDMVSGVPWFKTTGSAQCNGGGAGVSINGLIDFSRSSNAPSGATGTQLTWVDIAHDALSYAYEFGTGDPLNAAQQTAVEQGVTKANLTAAYNTVAGTGFQTVTASDGTTVVLVPVTLQAGSGTWNTFLTKIGDTQAEAAASIPAGSVGHDDEENGADAFNTVAQSAITSFETANGLTPATTPAVAIEPFSAGAWIAQANGVALDRSSNGRAAGVDLGNVDAAGGAGAKPYLGTPGTETPNTTFYASTQWGRDLFVILPFATLNGGVTTRSAPARAIFGNSAAPTSGQICSTAVASTVASYGFTTAAAGCGTETQTVVTTGNGA